MLQAQMQDMPVFRDTLDNPYGITLNHNTQTETTDRQTFNYIKSTRKHSRRPSSNASPRSSFPNPYLPTQQHSRTSNSDSSTNSSPYFLPSGDLNLNFGLLNENTAAPNTNFARRNSSLNSLINTSNPFSAYYAQPKARHSMQQAMLGRNVPDVIHEDGSDEKEDENGSMSDIDENDQDERAESISSIYEEEEQEEHPERNIATAQQIAASVEQKWPILSTIEIPSRPLSQVQPQARAQQQYQYSRNQRHSSHISPCTRTRPFSYASRPVSHISTLPTAPLASNPTIKNSVGSITALPTMQSHSSPPTTSMPETYIYPYPNPYPIIPSTNSSTKQAQAFTSAASPSSTPPRLSLQLRIIDSATSPSHLEKAQTQHTVCEKIPLWQQEELNRQRTITCRLSRLTGRMTVRQRVALGLATMMLIVGFAVMLGIVLVKEVRKGKDDAMVV